MRSTIPGVGDGHEQRIPTTREMRAVTEEPPEEPVHEPQICPACTGETAYDREEHVCVCARCGRTFEPKT